MATYRLKRKYFGAVGEIGSAAANIVGGTVNAAKNTAGAVLEGTGDAVKTVGALATPVGMGGAGLAGGAIGGVLGGPVGAAIGAGIGGLVGSAAGGIVDKTAQGLGKGLKTAGQGMQGY